MQLPRTVHNRITYVGAAIGGLGSILFLFLFILHTLTGPAQAPYAGLVIFILVPAIIVFGLALVPIGMLVEWNHIRRTGEVSIPRFPVVDLNRPQHFNAVLIFLGGGLLLLFISSFGGFQAVEATESVAFCGRTCHTVMQPEYVTYQHSPHARVRCVACHVGPGAEWYIKSKLTGARQLYGVVTGDYPKPIPSPISSLRPAQVTCEGCHWPNQFYASQEKKLTFFLPDEKNSPWMIDLLIKIGGGNPAAGRTGGIHWHMNIDNRVDYIATDPQRQKIPWVRITNRETGRTTVYQSTESPLTPQQVASATKRQMDCMDCHNRPTHIFRSPRVAVNLDMSMGEIDPSLPFVRREGVTLLTAEYSTKQAALKTIGAKLGAFYKKKYPKLADEKHKEISQAVAALQQIYAQNFFPEMKVRWDVYPNNVGHLESDGCFRCHDGEHKSADGRVIPNSCTTCHTIRAQGPPDKMEYASGPEGLPFHHPEDIGGMWKSMKCDMCHTGDNP